MTTIPGLITGTVKIRVSGPTGALAALMTALHALARDDYGDPRAILAAAGVELSGYDDRCVSADSRTDITAWEATVKAAPASSEESGR